MTGHSVTRALSSTATRGGEMSGDTSMEKALSETHPRGPLAGVRIIDLSAVISGPFGTSILADQGADVIAVEQTRQPDVVRFSGPRADSADGVSAFWASVNRNKRAIALDLKHPDGKDLLRRLVAEADVVVQNFRPGALDRLELGWDVLSALNPQLIMCSVTAFGPDGPYAQRPAYDPVIQAVAGYADVQADANGVPQLVRTIVCDKVTALNVAQSICAALVARGNGAGGQHIEVAMLDASVHFLWPDAMWNKTYVDHDIEMPELSSIYRLQQSSNGWVIVYAISTDPQWQAMCGALGRPDLAEDPRFADLQSRLRNCDAANEAVQSETSRYTSNEVVEMMDRAGVPAAPVNTRASMLTDPQVLHRQLIVETEHPSAGPVRTIRPPALFSKTPSSLRSPAPRFGEHTDEVLSDILELTAEQLAVLRTSGVIR